MNLKPYGMDAAKKLATYLRAFPKTDIAYEEIGNEIAAICSSPEEIDWLVAQMKLLYSKWPGARELRAVFCQRYKPADGIEVVGVQAQLIEPENPAPLSRQVSGAVARCPECEGRGFVILQKGEHSAAHPCPCGVKPPGNEFAPLTGQPYEPRCKRCNDLGYFWIDKQKRHEWCTCQEADELREADPTWVDRLNAALEKSPRSPKPKPTQTNEITRADVERAEKELRDKRKQQSPES